MNLSNVIAHHAERYPDRLAISYGDEEISYGELLARTRRTAGVLREVGIDRGDVLGVLLHNAPSFIDVMCACAHLGAILMPLNWRLAAPELQYIVEHAGAKAIVTEPELEALTAGLGGLPRLQDLSADAAPVRDAAPVAGDDVMRLMYTSGTTSRPKGVMITYDNLYWKCAAHVVELEMTAADRGLACGPLYHVGALDITATNLLYVGGSIHI